MECIGCQKAWCCCCRHVSRSSRNCWSLLGISSEAMGYGCWCLGNDLWTHGICIYFYFDKCHNVSICSKYPTMFLLIADIQSCRFFDHLFKDFSIVHSFGQIAEEAGGVVTRMDGGSFSVFDRSVLVSNGVMHDKVNPELLSHSHTYFPHIYHQKSSICHPRVYSFGLYLFFTELLITA